MAKRKHLSMMNLPHKFKGRFNFDLDEEDFKCGYVPPNTALDTQKCIKLLSDWAGTRNAHFPGNPVLDYILSSTDKTQVCAWLCKFTSKALKTGNLTLLNHSPLRYGLTAPHHGQQKSPQSTIAKTL